MKEFFEVNGKGHIQPGTFSAKGYTDDPDLVVLRRIPVLIHNSGARRNSIDLLEE